VSAIAVDPEVRLPALPRRRRTPAPSGHEPRAGAPARRADRAQPRVPRHDARASPPRRPLEDAVLTPMR